MKHPNVVMLETLYSNFVKKDWNAVLNACPDQVTFQVAGKSKLAGKYSKDNFVQGFATKLQELSGGSFQMEVHDVLASDRHGIVLATQKITQNGKTSELRTVHVWRIENGKPVAGYEYQRDLYQFDAIWT
jgi:ketosteroid isomerase-like protein